MPRAVVSDSQPLDLAAGYLQELPFPAGAGHGDEEQDQTVPRLLQLGVFRILEHTPRMLFT